MNAKKKSAHQADEVEPDLDDLIFDVAWRAMTEAAGDIVVANDRKLGYPAFKRAMDEVIDSELFIAELDAMCDRIEDAIVPRACILCGKPTDKAFQDQQALN